MSDLPLVFAFLAVLNGIGNSVSIYFNTRSINNIMNLLSIGESSSVLGDQAVQKGSAK